MSIPRAVSCSGARTTTGTIPAGGERQPDDEADRGVAEHDAGRRQRVHGEREHECREAQAEQDPVEPGGERDRQHTAPRLGHLAAHLRDDPPAAHVARGGRQQQRSGDRDRRAMTCAERTAEQREAAERRDPAGERAAGERRAGQRGRAHPPRIAMRRKRVDHREAARRPRTGQAGDQRGDGERDQHGVFVWKYMTQKTRRPS